MSEKVNEKIAEILYDLEHKSEHMFPHIHGDCDLTHFEHCFGYVNLNISKHDDPMFVSGSVKYLDVDGLLSLCAPHRVTVAGMMNHEAADNTFAAANATERLRVIDDLELEAAMNEIGRATTP